MGSILKCKISFFEKYHSLVEKLNDENRFVLFSLLEDVMERFREDGSEDLENEFNERANPFLISTGMWKKEEDEEDEIQLMLDTFSTTSIKNSYSRISHFPNFIKKYQGKNKFNMKKDELEKLKSQILTFFKKKKSRDNIFWILSRHSQLNQQGEMKTQFFLSQIDMLMTLGTLKHNFLRTSGFSLLNMILLLEMT